MRCDLHTHSLWSGAADVAVVGRYARESYSEPLAVYEAARRRGMDLVTITDHDTIDGNLTLARLPEVFWSEEVTCTLPSGTIVHLGVFDITEHDHSRIARLRTDGEALFAFLAERNIPTALNHMLSPMTGPRSTGDYAYALDRVGLVESQNGNMPKTVNVLAGRAAERLGRAKVGGSDAHTVATVARAYTEVPGARSRAEFLAALREGATVPRGSAGSYAQLVGDITRVTAGAYRDIVGRALLGRGGLLPVLAALVTVPITALIPVIAFVARLQGTVAAHRDARRLERWPGFLSSADRRPTPSSLALEEAAL